MKAHNVHVMHDKQVIHKESDNHFYVKGKKSDSIANPRLLAQRPITLVLMMINSWSYVY